jgi:signal recognition particle receptor subunit beta
MVQFNFSERTIKAKVVYYGPPQSGKTTNLEQIHRLTDPEGANRLISLNTAQDRTLFFDLLPFSLGKVSGYDFKIQLYTVPGQVQYNATRRVVLAGADAVVFVADSQKTMARENVTAFENMKVNLLANRLVPEKVPLVLQYNKRDLGDLLPRAELDHALNSWNRKTFPAIAARGDGVVETFVAVVQDMLAAIALKYNLKEKGLDPAAVPTVVAQAFDALLRQGSASAALEWPPSAPSGSPPPGPVAVVSSGPVAATSAAPLSPGKVVIAQPPGAEPAYPGQAGSDASPVSEELLHRAIRSNVELAEALGTLVREVHLGLGAILQRTDQLLAEGTDPESASALVGDIRREAGRLRKVLRDFGRATQASPGAPRATLSPPDRTIPPQSRLPASVARQATSAPTLDGLVAEVAGALHAPLAAKRLKVRSGIAAGASLPRCPPAGLRRALAALLQGLVAAVAAGSAISVRAERKPVLLRGRDGRELRRDFLMLAFTHTASVGDQDQQRILKGADTGLFGQAYRLVREMGGFLRFAPLPEGMLETRAFLPL